MRTKIVIASLFGTLALASDAALMQGDYVDAIGCAQENPATPAAHCRIGPGKPMQCRCISRNEYATLARDWCASRAPLKHDPGCDQGYQEDLIAPKRGRLRFTVNIEEDRNYMDVAADSARLKVTRK